MRKLNELEVREQYQIEITSRFAALGIGSWWGNRRERNHWGNLGVNGRIILEWISRRWDVVIWTGLGWPSIGNGGGRL